MKIKKHYLMQWMNLKNWGIRMKVLLYGYGLMGKKVAHQLREKDEFERENQRQNTCA